MRKSERDAQDLERMKLQSVAIALDGVFNGDAKGDDRKTGFFVLVFPFNSEGGQANYISNGANRSDMIKFLRETADRFERQEE